MLGPAPASAATAGVADGVTGAVSRPGRLSGGAPPAFPTLDFLYGDVTFARFDMAQAASALLRAQAAAPTDAALAAQALDATVMAGDAAEGGVVTPARVTGLAKRLAGQPLAQLVLGDEAVRDGDFRRARRAYGLVSGGGFEGLRPLLEAASSWGAGDVDGALGALGARSATPNGIYALFGAQIALAAGRAGQAETLRNAGMSGLPVGNVVLVGVAADLAARRGELAAARRMIHAMVLGRPGMALSEPALDAALRTPAPLGPVAMIARADAAAGFAVGAMLANSIDQQSSGDDAGGDQGDHLPPAAVRDLSRLALRDELLRLRLALSVDPGLAPARIALAEVLADAGQPQAALLELAKVDGQSPLAPAALWSAAGIETDLGHADRARAIAAQLAAQFPGRAEPQQLFGDIAMHEKDFAGAASAYQRAVDLQAQARRHPAAAFGDTMDSFGTEDAQNDWPLLAALGAALEQAGHWPQAHAVLERALALAPDRPMLLNFLGYGDLEHAADDPHAVVAARIRLEKALSLAPDDPNIRDSLGYALLLQHDPHRALSLFEQAAEKMPEDPVINGHLGDAYMALGRPVEAVEQWEWALLCAPEPADAAELRRKLRAAGAAPVEAAASPAAATQR